MPNSANKAKYSKVKVLDLLSYETNGPRCEKVFLGCGQIIVKLVPSATETTKYSKNWIASCTAIIHSRSRSLICAFVVRIHEKHILSRRGSSNNISGFW